jgi:hypothetical protein
VPTQDVATAGTAKIIFVWTSTATTNSAVWDFAYRPVTGDNANSLDQATAVETVSVTDAAPGASLRQLEASATLTASNIAASDTIQFRLSLDRSSGSHTLAAIALLVTAEFEYVDA